ncbi:hypothetical protein BGZ61DRAFT_473598 [Ilyonectria robusta]|uniref:uncharacterized protein n=1 Tax=Ilyonectria robusta TaxID=1079257 RepID=UPI001E8ED9C6|nr:uncharacterized protein BGZ61DRAFT_473598 [Ilyonectria robusta]KAH8734933.1 hypothetical protein BGZ61DRAFT_473598 [Ilyonectria robusta]
MGEKPSALEEHHLIIRNLIEGSDTFDIDDAQEALNAYKALWPTQLQSGIELRIDAETLAQLATGLRNEAMQGRVIPEALYRAFIVAFCRSDAATGSDAQARDGAIVQAYDHAALREPSTRLYRHRPCQQTTEIGHSNPYRREG